jgi:glycosyltransferase involved in cell wall biosynthesis
VPTVNRNATALPLASSVTELESLGDLVGTVRQPNVVVEIVVPVHNEERALEASIRRLRAYLDSSFPFSALVTIADNASVDRTWTLCKCLATELIGVRAIRLEQKGRGRALRAAWQASDAQVLAYMDVDLATGLDALLPLVSPLLSGHSDVSIGSRLARGSRVVRSPRREVISRAYNTIVRTAMDSRLSDAQCGFKALTSDAARSLLPMIADNGWFFDTELLVLAEHLGMRVHEVPVDWVEDSHSSVDIKKTAVEDLKGLGRVSRQLAHGRHRAAQRSRHEMSTTALLARFTRPGTLEIVAYVLLYLFLRAPLGTYGAICVAVASCATTIGLARARFELWARVQIRIRHRVFRVRNWLLGTVSIFVTTFVTTALSMCLSRAVFGGSTVSETSAIVLGVAAAWLLRLVLLKTLMLHADLEATKPAGESRPRDDHVPPATAKNLEVCSR